MPPCLSILYETSLKRSNFFKILNTKFSNFLLFQRFHNEGADVVKVDGFEMVKTMAANVEVMMQHKIDAIKVNSNGKQAMTSLQGIAE